MYKLGGIRLSDRAGDWAKDVLEHFYTFYPEMMNVDAQVVFKKKEHNKGYGIGSINLGAVSVPIVINNFELAPIDVAITQSGAVIPFNKHTLQALISDTSAFKTLQPFKNSDTFKLLFDRNVLSMREDMIDASKGIEKNAQSRKSITDQYEEKFDSNPLIKQWFEKQAGTFIPATVEDLRENLTRDIYVLVKNATADFSYTGYLGNSVVDDVVEKQFNAEDLPSDVRDKKIVVKTASDTRPAPIQDFEVTYVLANGMRKLAVAKNGDYAEMPFGGEDIETKSELIDKLASVPKIGDYGMFLVNDQFTEPMSITRVEMHQSPEIVKFAAFNGLATKTYQAVRPVSDIVETDNANEYYIPMSSSWIKLGCYDPSLTRDSINYVPASITKVANGYYTWAGDVLTKYAESKHGKNVPFSSRDTMIALLNVGATDDDFNKVGALLQDGDRADIFTKLALKPTLDEVFKEGEVNAPEFKPMFKMADLVRIASKSKDPNTVDAVLGLGYLNTNVKEEQYFEYIPHLEEVLQRMSKMLLDIRLGALDMDEMIVSSAIEELSQLVITLKRLKQSRLNRRK
jgi:hypothetical protein